MRIIVLWDFYRSYVRHLWEDNILDTKMTYEECLGAIGRDYFWWPPTLVPHFVANGCTAALVVGNDERLQMQWARENSFKYDPNDWCCSIIEEQIKRFKPDVLFVGGESDGILTDLTRRLKSRVKCIVAWKAAAVSEGVDWDMVDCVFSSHQNIVDHFVRKIGVRSERVLPCFEPNILKAIPSQSRTIDVSFIGSLAMVAFRKRLLLLRSLNQHIPIAMFATRPRLIRRPWPLGPFLSQFQFTPFLVRGDFRTPVYGLDMLQTLAKSKITINVHVEAAGGLAGNIRMFEATGMGALLLTEAAPNLSELFLPGVEVVAYNCVEEAKQKVQFYIANESKRSAIALAGQRRTLTEHISSKRAKQVLALFDQLLR